MNENELKILRKKCNLQVEKILQLEKEKSEWESQRISLQKEIKVLQGKLQNFENSVITEQEALEEKSEVMIFFQNFLRLIQKLKENDVFIPYKNQSKNSSQYYKIEKEVFDQYIQEFSDLDRKQFIQFCSRLSFFKKESGGNYIFNNNTQRVYFLSKCMVDVL